jgi:phosphorylcholine metabolism protein LicD
MNILHRLAQQTDGWWIKEKLKPFYLPILHEAKYRAANKSFIQEGEGVLHAASKVLNEIKVFHWLEFGTLLGVVRDGKLISHDTDIDFGVFLGDRSKDIQRAFEKAGFRLVHRLEIDNGNYGLEESYELNGVGVDLFYFTKTEKGMYCHLFPFESKNKRLVRELSTTVNDFRVINWRDLDIHIPKEAEQRLRDTYGDFQTPNKNWHTPTQALNSKIIEKQYKEVRT